MPTTYRQTGILKWMDLKGGTRTNTVTLISNPTPTLGAFGTLKTAMQNASSCGLMYAALQPVVTVNATPNSGAYPTANDSLQLIFRSSTGSTGRLNIPGPIEELFLPDHERVDFANAKVQAIINAAYSALCDPNGNPWVTAVSGVRMNIRIPKASGG